MIAEKQYEIRIPTDCIYLTPGTWLTETYDVPPADHKKHWSHDIYVQVQISLVTVNSLI